ncbi:hypothetical protein [Lactobacillus brevis] [Lactiplantibacillus mudanjiangensis]|uniref:hypothetical protein n=1 Tax=Lactiplantibacillus mudanjiangensis TaxID=1296538 RepID=UPI00101413EB|nr:hypothetical protein [Lactiplantibacillus mudanjiangensis]VDG32872.1 hypothetical protein [Lactobacillus brevis] [Lactiplantibacillus mudanjiangensis]
MEKTDMGNVSAIVHGMLDVYAFMRKGPSIVIADRRSGEAFVIKCGLPKAIAIEKLLVETHPNKDIGKIEFDTSTGPMTIDELIQKAPDKTLAAKMGLV